MKWLCSVSGWCQRWLLTVSSEYAIKSFKLNHLFSGRNRTCWTHSFISSWHQWRIHFSSAASFSSSSFFPPSFSSDDFFFFYFVCLQLFYTHWLGCDSGRILHWMCIVNNSVNVLLFGIFWFYSTKAKPGTRMKMKDKPSTEFWACTSIKWMKLGCILLSQELFIYIIYDMQHVCCMI